MQLDAVSASDSVAFAPTKKLNIPLGVLHVQYMDRKITGQKYVTTKKRTQKDADNKKCQKFKPGSWIIQGNHQYRHHQDRKCINCVYSINACQDDTEEIYEHFEQMPFDMIH